MTRLGDVVDMTIGCAFKSKDFSDRDTDIRLLRGDNIVQGRLRWSGAKRFPVERLHEFARYQLALGDVVVAMDRPWIEAGLKYSVIREADMPSLLVQRVARLRARDELDQGFLALLIGSRAFTEHVISVQTGSAVPHISGKQIAEFSLGTLPPLAVQRGIAATLGALDDKIESNYRQQAAAQSLLRASVDRLLSLHRGPMTVLSTYCHLVKDGVPADKIDPESRYIGFDLMPRGQIFLDDWRTADGLGSNKWRFRAGDILFGKLRPYFKKVGIAPIDGLCSTDILTIRPLHRKDTALIAIVASSDALIEKVSASATGTRMPRTSWSDVAAWELPALADGEREALAFAAEPLIERMTLLSHETKRLRDLRDTLLPELLSGRIRVPEAREAIAEAGASV